MSHERRIYRRIFLHRFTVVRPSAQLGFPVPQIVQAEHQTREWRIGLKTKLSMVEIHESSGWRR